MKKEIYLAGGCFWGVEEYYSRLNGVISTEVGYANGTKDNPSYSDLKSGLDEIIAAHDDDESVTIFDDVQRHVVQIQDIVGITGDFDEAELNSIELIDQPVDSISIFANEYVPPSYPKNSDGYVQYILTVNGVDYDIVPINSNKTGTKVIRYANYLSTDSYVKHIKEPIKNATLTIRIIPDAQTSPVLTNIKACYGKAVSK